MIIIPYMTLFHVLSHCVSCGGSLCSVWWVTTFRVAGHCVACGDLLRPMWLVTMFHMQDKSKMASYSDEKLLSIPSVIIEATADIRAWWGLSVVDSYIDDRFARFASWFISWHLLNNVPEFWMIFVDCWWWSDFFRLTSALEDHRLHSQVFIDKHIQHNVCCAFTPRLQPCKFIFMV